MPSGTIIIKAAPTSNPAPKIEMRFMTQPETGSLVGAKPRVKVVMNMPRERRETESI